VFPFVCDCVCVYVCVCEDDDVFDAKFMHETLYLRACVLVCNDDAHVYTRDVAWVVHSVSLAGLRWGSVIEQCWRVYVHEPVFVRVDLVSSCPCHSPLCQ
jgi:hypothetical protein